MKYLALSCALLINLNATTAKAQDYFVSSYPLLEAIESSGRVLSGNTKKWMNKWNNINLEDLTTFEFNEISGTTSINLKIRKIDSTDPKGFKSLGTFVSLNESANPNSEIAYFSLASIVGVDKMYRPSVRYELGRAASLKFKNLLDTTLIKGSQRLNNKKNILLAINSGKPLAGCLKAKKNDLSIIYDEMTKTGWFSSTPTLKSNHAVVKLIQANQNQPKKGEIILLKGDYQGDAKDLAREFSIILTLDTVFGQYDRFTGGNIVIEKDQAGVAHFVATDNGGADIVASTVSAKSSAELFSRYDRSVITKLIELSNFLNNPSTPFLGYTDPERLVVDMGMYFRFSPSTYVAAIKKNIAILLNQVKANEKRFGDKIYFED